MSVTVNLTQLKRKKLKSGEIPIYIRFTENRRSKYLSTGISVSEKDWNKREQKVRKSHPLYKRYNEELNDLKLSALKTQSDLRRKGELDIDTLKDELDSNSSETIKTFGEKYTEKLKKHDRFWEYKHVNVAINDIKAMGKVNLPVSRIDKKFLEAFQDYMLHSKGNKRNTVRNKLQRFKGLVDEAIKQGLINQDPYYKFERVRKEKVNRAKLGEAEIDRIKGLELKEETSIWHVRNYFMFSFYLAGIRFSDICTLKPNNLVDGRLKYQMRKTGGNKSIKLLEPALEILKHYNTDGKGYIFPILDKVYNDEFVIRRKISSKNVIVNRELKELAKKAKIDENLSFHISRHSFANYALQKGMDVYNISKALAHSNLKTTEAYLKSFDEELLDKEMDNIFN